MKATLFALAAVGLICLCSLARADVFSLGTGLTNLETVYVGDAGNAADTAARSGNPSGRGSVARNYNIGRYEVTAAQYCDFLNHKANVSDPYGLYSSFMWGDPGGCKIQKDGSSGNYTYTVDTSHANRAVNYVSYWDACRFANWLGNGQGDGDTENGAYTLDGYSGDGGQNIQRNADWTWAVTSDDEWYKAAYYKGGSLDAGYWNCATQSDSITASMANHNMYVGHTTDVGAYAYPSAYGTFDQAGNVWEWNEGLVGGSYRGLTGGSYNNDSASLQASSRMGYAPLYESNVIGFRVAAVPEPSSIPALLVGLAGLVGVRRRRP